MSEVIASPLPPPIPRSRSQVCAFVSYADELVRACAAVTTCMLCRRRNRDRFNPGVRWRTDNFSVGRRDAQYHGGDSYRACPGLQLHRYRMIRGRGRGEGGRELPSAHRSVPYRYCHSHPQLGTDIATGTDTRITQKAVISDKLHHRIGKRIS
ncbi:unnamed protein product [Tuber melanosporum]|uniref:(Perigord truffle) hypothetical protein n=1 Tax=Tuber melanosporum (strain Mel28) TaxID=656061 RepID=D5GFQ1_TUBMM|nr:uncharacterized protein GSTUM_00007004001 [Tuber melanosporum]CAZ83344.1 unnamed protein product [Tuber melanosporum]